MLKFYYDPKYKYTNRTIIDVTNDTNYVEKNYVNIDSPDTINGHITYQFSKDETEGSPTYGQYLSEDMPTYVIDTTTSRRWFVSGITQLNSYKYQISLLRDVVSEGNAWKEEEAYIQAGTATNYNKYKIWNLPYTNTKVNQQRLNINGKSSFFVYYVNEQHFGNDGAITEDDLKLEYATIPGIGRYQIKVTNLNSIPHYNFVGAGNITTWESTRCSIQIRPLSGTKQKWTLTDHLEVTEDSTNIPYWASNYFNTTKFNNNVNGAKDDVTTAMVNFINSYQANTNIWGYVTGQSQIEDLDAYVGKIIFDENTNKYYRINKTQNYLVNHTEYLTNTTVGTLISALNSIQMPQDTSTTYELGLITTNNAFFFNSVQRIQSYTLTELGTAQSFKLNLTAGIRKLPKSAVRCVNIVSNNTVSDNDIAQCLMLAQTNPANISDTGRILDVQYLPFSIAEDTDTSNDIKINGSTIPAKFIDDDDFLYDINLTDLTDIHKETDTIKIVSPSRASQYLFRPYNNDGNMEFAVKITLKPYASTIYIRPSTRGLLMYDWDDKDCLIINEDFSLTNVTSQWTEYVYSNKNYSNIFEREIQGREFERGWERKVEQAQKAMDKITARNIEGSIAKNQLWNLPIISQIGAGLASSTSMNEDYLKAAATDRQYNEALYQEGISISRDMFNYQLDNVKSQPLIPSKITTIDCKLLDGVYLEFYSTNPTELAAIDNYYKYNGHRIDDFGTFSQYYGHFIKGRIIISSHYTQPEIDEINRRLEMGIFTEVSYGN